MRALVVICPECGESQITQMSPAKLAQVTFISRCGTRIAMTVDTRNAVEQRQYRAEKANLENG